ncbi:MAG: ATP-dependent Clp protease proteolytic subunit [Candidatus Wallbacteria bacterium HGW-Wallbacteria-1]|uniref:ATP-dependent Clp protease proteolytic subunit n=1 Tax=Candidatus Wallbacteria bacterium HGW-Wallbacteria-1 TaxID=2013854 RepID=A0A2N1PK79_9BACT|nr:MAG: ATP-dependent Clp protease proteolytic subunit [Candidatus Wallbacteria bacterium HGW-Wallbacteria-1]
MPAFCDEEEEEDEKVSNGSSESKLFEKLLKLRTIFISGEINKDLADKVMKQLLVLEAASDDPINVYIDSPGGDADAGFAIFDFLKFVKPRIRTICAGLTASAGSLILLAAEKEDRLSLPNSRILIHQPLGGAMGSATEIAIQAEQIIKLRQRINEVISEATGQDIKKVSRDTERDCWLTAQESLEYGLISRIISRKDELEG